MLDSYLKMRIWLDYSERSAAGRAFSESQIVISQHSTPEITLENSLDLTLTSRLKIKCRSSCRVRSLWQSQRSGGPVRISWWWFSVDKRFAGIIDYYGSFLGLSYPILIVACLIPADNDWTSDLEPSTLLLSPLLFDHLCHAEASREDFKLRSTAASAVEMMSFARQLTFLNIISQCLGWTFACREIPEAIAGLKVSDQIHVSCQLYIPPGDALVIASWLAPKPRKSLNFKFQHSACPHSFHVVLVLVMHTIAAANIKRLLESFWSIISS